MAPTTCTEEAFLASVKKNVRLAYREQYVKDDERHLNDGGTRGKSTAAHDCCCKFKLEYRQPDPSRSKYG